MKINLAYFWARVFVWAANNCTKCDPEFADAMIHSVSKDLQRTEKMRIIQEEYLKAVKAAK